MAIHIEIKEPQIHDHRNSSPRGWDSRYMLLFGKLEAGRFILYQGVPDLYNNVGESGCSDGEKGEQWYFISIQMSQFSEHIFGWPTYFRNIEGERTRNQYSKFSLVQRRVNILQNGYKHAIKSLYFRKRSCVLNIPRIGTIGNGFSLNSDSTCLYILMSN